MLKHLLLEYLYQNGYRFIVRDSCGWAMAYGEKPKQLNSRWMAVRGKSRTLGAFGDIFDDLPCEEIFDIAKELNIVNWLKVPPGTNVYVRNYEDEPWKLARYLGYIDGLPSPFVVCDNDCKLTDFDIKFYNYCKLA